MLLRLDRALLGTLRSPRPEHDGVSHCQGQGRLVMTRAIEDFAAIKARLDELRREKEQQQPVAGHGYRRPCRSKPGASL
jgi:hypothetical protein